MPFPILWASQFGFLDGPIGMDGVPLSNMDFLPFCEDPTQQSREIAEGYPMNECKLTAAVHFPSAKVHTKPSPLTK